MKHLLILSIVIALVAHCMGVSNTNEGDEFCYLHSVETVTDIPNLVAFLDFVNREKDGDGAFSEVDLDLYAISLNPWWYPHGIYCPKDDGSGGPFTIGRVIHSARESGYSGWIGEVAVFDRALTGVELKKLTDICRLNPSSLETTKDLIR